MALNIKHCNKSQFDPHIEVLPSTKLYFGDYPYKVEIKGPGHPHPDYDPHFQYEVTDFMKSCNMFYKRELHTMNGRSIYLGTYDDVLWLCNWMGDHVKAVHGPVSDEHVSCLLTPGLILRKNLFYKEYDYRIEFYSGSFRDRKSTDYKKQIKLLMNFVDQNFENYRWASSHFQWFYNYLYCQFDEYTEMEGFMNLSFKNILTAKDKVKLFSEL